MAENPDSSHDSGAAAAPALAPDSSVEFVLSQADTSEKFCTALAKLFGVRPKEVAMLRLEKGLLKFVFPEQLKTAGFIPVSSSSSVAAHTASTKKTQLFNTFTKVKHARVFETVKLATAGEDESEQASIQKLMSAPVLSSDRKVLGVIQVSRKAFDPASAGPDFTLEDLQQLELVAKVASKMPFMKERSAS
ncbi:MAG TPA: GAF domain-containing protein [Terriglobales bacterium]|nr:GAF domain-containing protein [Terriglobales bacterium]